MIVHRILEYVRMLLSEVPQKEQQYTRGYRDAGEAIEQKIEELMWEEGIDEAEEE